MAASFSPCRNETPEYDCVDLRADSLSDAADDADDVDDVDDVDERAWCVERGTDITAMTTHELFVAVEAGEIRADTRVWREGLECWARIKEIPELSPLGALDVDLTMGTAITPPAVEIACPPTLPSAGATVELGSAPGHPSRPLRGSAPSRAPDARSWRAEAAQSSAAAAVSRAAPRLVIDRSGAFWVGGGIAFAASAIGLALLTIPSPYVETPRAAVARELPALRDTQEAITEAVADLRRAEGAVTLSRSEPGQKRMRSGAGRARRR